MVMSHTQELVFLCMLNFFMLVQSSADGPEQTGGGSGGMARFVHEVYDTVS